MTVTDFISASPKFYEQENPLLGTWKTVSTQARLHSSRDSRAAIFTESRPGEDEAATSYRESNDRLITKEGVDKFVSLSVRIFKNSHIELSGDSINQNLSEWLAKKPFSILTQKVGILDYFYTVAYRYGIDDANAAWLAFPVSRIGTGMAPIDDRGEDGELILNLPVAIESRLIPSERIKKRDDIFGFQGESVIVEIPELTNQYGEVIDEASAIWMPVYYLADDMDWMQYYPIANPKRKLQNEERIIYVLTPWYHHGSGEVPVTNLPGTLNYWKDSDGFLLPYYESILHSYFEYGDEVIQLFSDWQATMRKFSYPKIVMSEMICNECHGAGKITPRTADGYMQEDKGGNVIRHQCTSCGGSGVVKDPGPLQTLLVKVGSNGIDKVASEAIYKEILPPTDSLRSTYDMVFDIYERGKRSIGIDILSQLNESGKAHQVRLEIQQDKLGDVAEQSCNSIEKFLKYADDLLNPDEDQRLQPKIVRPKSLSVKTAEVLLDEAKEAPECARQDAYMEYYSVRFRHDPKKLRIYELAMGYSALLCLNNEEIEIRLAKGAYDVNDVIRADRAVWAFTQLSGEDGFFDQEKTDEFYDKAEALIVPYFVELVSLANTTNGVFSNGVFNESNDTE